jgi:hypothetical protein
LDLPWILDFQPSRLALLNMANEWASRYFTGLALSLKVSTGHYTNAHPPPAFLPLYVLFRFPHQINVIYLLFRTPAFFYCIKLISFYLQNILIWNDLRL